MLANLLLYSSKTCPYFMVFDPDEDGSQLLMKLVDFAFKLIFKDSQHNII